MHGFNRTLDIWQLLEITVKTRETDGAPIISRARIGYKQTFSNQFTCLSTCAVAAGLKTQNVWKGPGHYQKGYGWQQDMKLLFHISRKPWWIHSLSTECMLSYSLYYEGQRFVLERCKVTILYKVSLSRLQFLMSLTLEDGRDRYWTAESGETYMLLLNSISRCQS